MANNFNDITSAIKVGPNTQVTVWENDIGSGRSFTFNADIICLYDDMDLTVRAFNDMISSARAYDI